MRPFCLLAALCAASVAAAQIPTDRHERDVWDAYQNFRRADAMRFEMKGYERYGSSETPIHAVLFLRRSNDPRTGLASRAQADLSVFRTTKAGEVYAYRIVGDGVNLFRYDFDRGEVSTTTYGFYGDRAPENYANNVRSDMPKLLAQLRAATPGLAIYLTRLASEINPSGDLFAARFSPWAPGTVQTEAGRPNGQHGLYFEEVPAPVRYDKIVTDPITGSQFVQGGDRYVFCNFDGWTPDRTVAFDLHNVAEPDQPEIWEVASVSVALRSVNRIVALNVVPTAIASAPEGTFVPYTGREAQAFRPVSRGH